MLAQDVTYLADPIPSEQREGGYIHPLNFWMPPQHGNTSTKMRPLTMEETRQRTDSMYTECTVRTLKQMSDYLCKLPYVQTDSRPCMFNVEHTEIQ
jgi:hypothetical protein